MKWNNYNILCIVLVSIITFCYGYKDCGSNSGKIVEINISGCNNGKTCILKKNTNVTLEITFTALEDSDTLSAVVYGYIGNIPLPFPLLNPDGCQNSGINCPLRAGQTYKYTNVLPILEFYPTVSVKVQWELRTADYKCAVCILIPAKIK